MSIRRKLLLLYFLVAGIPVLAVGIYNHFHSLAEMSAAIGAEMRADLQPSAAAFGELAGAIAADLDVLAWNYELHDLLAAWYRQQQSDPAAALGDEFAAALGEFAALRIGESPLTYLALAYCDTAGVPVMMRDFRKGGEADRFGGGGAEARQRKIAEKLYRPDPLQRARFQKLGRGDGSNAVVGVSAEALSIAVLVLDEDEVDYIGMLVVDYAMQDLLALGGIRETPAEHAVHLALSRHSEALLFQNSRGEYALDAAAIGRIGALAAATDSARTEELSLSGLPGTWALELRSHPGLGIDIGMLRNITEATRTWRQASFRSLVALLSILVLSGILIGLVVSRITRSIGAVSAAAQEIAGGNLEQDITVASQDELRGLADSFNTMSVSLRQTMSNLEELNQTLESRVARRTRELESANTLIEEQKCELEEELVKAHEMQMRLMPERAPQVAGFDLAGECRTATHVGGDFFQYFALPDGRICFVVADVTGHGMEAAVPTMVFSGLLGNQIAYSNSPEHLYGKLNQSLYDLLEKRTFICFAMGELAVDEGRVRICNSGCPYPYHYNRATDTVSEICLDAFPLGLRENASYEVFETLLERGDRIVLCSDGIVEASDVSGEIFGFERTAEAIRTACHADLDAGALIQHVFSAASQFSQRIEREDDQTMVVLHATS